MAPKNLRPKASVLHSRADLIKIADECARRWEPLVAALVPQLPSSYPRSFVKSVYDRLGLGGCEQLIADIFFWPRPLQALLRSIVPSPGKQQRGELRIPWIPMSWRHALTFEFRLAEWLAEQLRNLIRLQLTDEERTLVGKELAALVSRDELRVLELLYGLSGSSPLGPKAAAKVLHCSYYRVWRLKRTALTKLRDPSRAICLKAFWSQEGRKAMGFERQYALAALLGWCAEKQGLSSAEELQARYGEEISERFGRGE